MTILEKELKKIPARVKKGIKWFEDLGISKDELEELITPEELRMEDCYSCMIGQVIGSYWYAFSQEEIQDDQDVPYGFNVPENLCTGGNGFKYYRELELEWGKQLGFCKECIGSAYKQQKEQKLWVW